MLPEPLLAVFNNSEKDFIKSHLFFYQPCLENFRFLVDQHGFRWRINAAQQGQLFFYLTDDVIKIEIGYEPFDLPWCFIHGLEKATTKELESLLPEKPFHPIIRESDHELSVELWITQLSIYVRENYDLVRKKSLD